MNPIARVGLAVIGEAAIQETGDVGVVERGQHPAFGEKPLAKARRGEAGENELAGDRLLEAAGDAAAEVDGAHAAAAYEALQAVGAEGAAGVAGGLARWPRMRRGDAGLATLSTGMATVSARARTSPGGRRRSSSWEIADGLPLHYDQDAGCGQEP